VSNDFLHFIHSIAIAFKKYAEPASDNVFSPSRLHLQKSTNVYNYLKYLKNTKIIYSALSEVRSYPLHSSFRCHAFKNIGRTGTQKGILSGSSSSSVEAPTTRYFPNTTEYQIIPGVSVRSDYLLYFTHVHRRHFKNIC
jgi:hypothetical protein